MVFLIFIFTLKIYFYIKMKRRDTTTNCLNLDKCYPGHDPEQHSRGFSRRSDTLGNANAGAAVTSKSTLALSNSLSRAL